MSRRLGLLLLVFGLGVALLVSAAFAGPNGESRRGGTLRLMWGAEPDSLDPALATGTVGSFTLLHATCAKLFNTLVDPETSRTRTVPEVVRRWTVSNSGRTYTFELKRTFRFHNGTPVTAQSFANAFNRNAVMNSLVRRRGFLGEIVGARAAMQGTAKTLSGVQVLGHYRLRIRLTRRAGDFVARLTMPSFCPILPGTPIDPAGIDDPPGSGPYYVADHIRNRLIVLQRNPYYRGGRTANADRILWTIETDAAERIRATESAGNDFTPLFGVRDAVVRDLVDRYGVNRPGGQLLRLPKGLGNFLFAFNHDRPAFRGVGQAPLRKAINYALDRRALVQTHGYLATRSTDRLLPASLSKSRRLYPLDGADPVTARRWLDRAKHRPQTLTLYAANFSLFSVPNAQVFVSNLRQLGIEVNVKYFAFPVLADKLNTDGEPWDVAWLPWGAFYADPAGGILPLLRRTRYEAQINAANRVRGAARRKSWAAVETDLMRDDPPVAVYADATALILVSRNFGCLLALQGYELDLAAACKR